MPTFSKTLQNGYRLDLIMTLTGQSVANNTSSYDYVLRLVDTTSWRAWSGYNASWSVRSPTSNTLSSGSVSGYNFANYSTLTLRSGSATFTHSADGTSSRGVYGAFSDPNGPVGSGSATGTLKSPTIPRATTPSISGSFTTGSAKTISLPRASSAFTHEVKYKVGTLSGTISSSAGTSVSWTPPHSLASAFPNATSASCTITVVTKNGSSTVGTKTKTVTLNAAASLTPTVSAVTLTDQNATIRNNIGAFVQGLSQISGVVTASGVQGSTIRTRNLRVGTTNIDEGTPIIFDEAGTLDIYGEATDSRGRSGSLLVSTPILAYKPPELGTSGFQVSRANSSNVATDTGTYLRVDLSAAAQPLLVGGVQKNALKISVRTRSGTSAWTQRNTITGGLSHNAAFQVTGGGVFLTTSSYEVEITLSDNTGVTPTKLLVTVPTASVALDLNGTNVGVGKYWERGALDVAGQIYQDGQRVADQSFIFKHQTNGNVYQVGDPTTWTNIYTGLLSQSVGGATDRLFWAGINNAIRLMLFQNGDLQLYGSGNLQLAGRVRSSSAPSVLWSGVYYMNDSQTINLTERISDQLNGVILAWSAYSGGVANNYDWNYTVVSKWHVANYPNAGLHASLGTNATNNLLISKYLYVDDTAITGHASNGTGDDASMVLRAVIGY